MKGLESKAMEILLGYEWPGNVRELENVIERSVVLDRDGIIGADDLPADILLGEHPGHGIRDHPAWNAHGGGGAHPHGRDP